jgi:hypothetical protein
MSITIHEIAAELNERLSLRARQEGISKNQLVKDLLARAVGLPASGGYADDYREFCGIWTAAEQAEFEAAQRENRAVDPEDW